MIVSYGRTITLVTDHKSLLAILGPNSGVPTMAAARMQRWAVLLSAYDYDIKCRNSASHANCDALSRLPNPESSSEGIKVKCLHDFPVLAKDVTK